jgi:hypothetical protein
MFIEGLIISIIIGYILKGKLENLINIEIKFIWIAFVSYLIKFAVFIPIRHDFINRSIYTFIIDIFMYLLMFTFIYLNRKNIYLLFMGLGFLLNAIAIFSNGGAMPVSERAMKVAGLAMNIPKQGLYMVSNSSTKFYYLCDVIPIAILRHTVVSIGDIISTLAFMGLIITTMRQKEILTETINA